MGKIRRFFMRWAWMRAYEKSLNERAAVEQEMRDFARGSPVPPSREELMEWARRLGVPARWRS